MSVLSFLGKKPALVKDKKPHKPLEPIRKRDNRLQIRPFGQVFRFFLLNSPLFALKNRKTCLKIANFRFDSPSSYRLLSLDLSKR